jgi:hypothetical protein
MRQQFNAPVAQGRKFSDALAVHYRPAENNVLLCPGMKTAAVGTSELLWFHYRRSPPLFLYCPAGIRQL